MKKYARELFWGSFALYLVFLLWILFFSREPEKSVPLKAYVCRYSNLIPFKTTMKYVRYFILREDFSSFMLGVYNILGNFLLFLPNGIYLPHLFSKWQKKSVFFVRIFFVIVIIESAQAFFQVGIFDIDDILLNFFGAVLGYVINKSFPEYIFDSISK